LKQAPVHQRHGPTRHNGGYDEHGGGVTERKHKTDATGCLSSCISLWRCRCSDMIRWLCSEDRPAGNAFRVERDSVGTLLPHRPGRNRFIASSSV